MTLRMPKIVTSSAEGIAKSVAWAAVSRLGVPIILALVLTGIPAHLLWAQRVNQDLALTMRDVTAVVAEVKAMKEAAKDDRKTETQVLTDLASLKTNVAAILRSIDRIEKLNDAQANRRQP